MTSKELNEEPYEVKISCTLIEVSDYFSDAQCSIEFLKTMRWKDGIKCTFCKHHKVYELNGKNKRYKCALCKKQFSLISGTIFENTKVPLRKWFMAIYLLVSRKKGVSSIQLSDDIGVSQPTAWFMSMRIREMLKDYNNNVQLTDIVQVDETYVGGKNKNRRWNKKVPNSQGRSVKDKTPVFGILQQAESHTIRRPHKLRAGEMVNEKIVTRQSKLYCKVLSNVQGSDIKPVIYHNVKEGSTIVSDEWKAYRGLNGRYNHHIVNHQRKQYVNEEGYTSNAVENAWSILKRMIIGIYYKVSRKHLHRYVNEFTFRFNNRNLKGYAIIEAAMVNLERRLTRKDLAYKRSR